MVESSEASCNYGYVASKLDVVDWSRRRESMDTMTKDYGEVWRPCPSETREALVMRRETPRSQCAHDLVMLQSVLLSPPPRRPWGAVWRSVFWPI